jgi:hypothetical protein
VAAVEQETVGAAQPAAAVQAAQAVLEMAQREPRILAAVVVGAALTWVSALVKVLAAAVVL